MELEQSIAENNLFGSLNSEMKKLMSSMLDYCKQHESDIKRYKRKHEEIEEDIRFSKAMPPVKIKRDKLLQLVRYREYQRKRLKEREISKDRMKALPPTAKELRGFHVNGKEFTDGKKMPFQSTSSQSDTGLVFKDPRDLLYKEFLHPKETSIHKDLMTPKELSHCRDLSRPDKKIIYSREVLRSKELLKERYLRDCTKMKMKEIPLHAEDVQASEEALDTKCATKNSMREVSSEVSSIKLWSDSASIAYYENRTIIIIDK